MSHYYQFDDSVGTKKRNLELFILGEKINFISDNGVFSNKEIDYGSFLLIKELLNQPFCETLLDVGCGYGVIGLTLKHFKKVEYLEIVDINPRAVELAQINLKLLNLKNVNIYQNDCLDNIQVNFDRIAINPPIRAGKKVIYKMFEQAYERLNSSGELWIVIKKDLGAPSALNKLISLNFKTKIILKNKGYWIIQAKK